MTRLTRLHTALSLATMLAGSALQYSASNSQRPHRLPRRRWQPGTTRYSRQTPGITTPGTPPNRDDQMKPVSRAAPADLPFGQSHARRRHTAAGSVVIEPVCNGNPRAEAYTDSKGPFSFPAWSEPGCSRMQA